jgi:hypothetical protein
MAAPEDMTPEKELSSGNGFNIICDPKLGARRSLLG